MLLEIGTRMSWELHSWELKAQFPLQNAAFPGFPLHKWATH